MKLPITLVPNAPIIAGMKTDKSQILGIPGFPELSNEDAAFIVRACNSHAALVALLDRFLELDMRTGQFDRLRSNPAGQDGMTEEEIAYLDLVESARAALQSAKPTA